MNIPSRAKRVFDGEIFDVYQWEEKMYDGSTATFEALKRPATIQIIPTFENKMLLSYEEQPGKPRMFSFFGGRAEEGEEPLETAKRELLEEAGMVSSDWELYKTDEFEGKIEWKSYLFIARTCEKKAEQALDPGERIEVKSFPFDEWMAIVTDPTRFWGRRDSDTFFRLLHDKPALSHFRERVGVYY